MQFFAVVISCPDVSHTSFCVADTFIIMADSSIIHALLLTPAMCHLSHCTEVYFTWLAFVELTLDKIYEEKVVACLVYLL